MRRKSTDSNRKILNRTQAIVEAKRMIEVAGLLLQEIVNYATHAYLRCFKAGAESLKDLPAFTLYMHMIEMTDGIEVLLSQSCREPATLLLRSSFEALLSLKYLFREDYERRSLSWLYLDRRTEIGRYEQLDPESQRGKTLKRALAEEQERDGVQYPIMNDELLQYVRELRKEEGLDPIEQEYQRTKKRIKNPEWFALFDGPQNRQKLAEHLGLESFYILVNRPWTEAAHARDLSRYMSVSSDGTVAGHQLRLAGDLPRLADLAGTFLRDATDLMLMKFRPHEPNHERWTHEIWNRLKKLDEMGVRLMSGNVD